MTDSCNHHTYLMFIINLVVTKRLASIKRLIILLLASFLFLVDYISIILLLYIWEGGGGGVSCHYR